MFNILELRNICYSPEDGVDILNGVSLTIDDARLTVVTGPNGSGKSTLAKAIVGIIQPNSGQIIFNGQDITGLGITERARLGIAYAFQQPVRFKGLTVGALLNIAAGKKLSYQEARDALFNVGLCARDYLSREANDSLSGGEMKRVELACAILREAQFTVFDEPEAGIDIWSFNGLLNVFAGLKERKKAALVISHQQRIFEAADEIIVLDAGAVTMRGPREAVLPKLFFDKTGCSQCPKRGLQ